MRVEQHRVTAGWRELILWEQLANAHEFQPPVFEADEPHPAKPHPDVAVRLFCEYDLIGWQRHPEAVRKEHECAWRPIS